MLVNPVDRMIDPPHRYVSTAICPIGKNEAECAALAQRIFDREADAQAALVEHLASDCHTQQQLARVVGAVRTHIRSFRLVHEDRGAGSVAERRSATEPESLASVRERRVA